jgi:ribosomal protein S18 acetylase RimI-like enzyme
MNITRLPDDMRILHVQTPEEISRWAKEFERVYPMVFTQAPYFEATSAAKAREVWDHLTAIPENITLIALTPQETIAGFGIAIPLKAQRDVATSISGLIPVPHTFYLAELGVLEEHRGCGLGRSLVRRRMQLIDRQRYEGVMLRVAEDRNTSKSMYEAMGFEDMGVYMDVSADRVDGTTRSDKRLFLHCVLSQMKLDRADSVQGAEDVCSGK